MSRLRRRLHVQHDGPGWFSAGGSVVLVDTASESIVKTIDLFALPGSMAFTPDCSRAYVGIQSIFVNTGYGMGFLPGRAVYVIDALTERLVSFIDLGGVSPTGLNAPSGIAVTPDRASVYYHRPRQAGPRSPACSPTTP
jgi:DNA-binding beta-propeller fold protein YncE